MKTKIDTTVRRWCPTCSKVTKSWLTAELDECCAGCEPEDPAHPGYPTMGHWDSDEW